MRDFLAFLGGNIKAAILIVVAGALFILDDIGRVQQMNALPHYIWQIAAALVFMGAVISILYHQHKRIESFQPLPPDAAAAALSNAIAQLTYLRDVRADFEKRAADADVYWNTLIASVSVAKPDDFVVPSPVWKKAYEKWVAEIRAIQKGALDAMEFKREFLESFNFQRNPGIKVLDEDNLASDADKYELRRAYDEHNSALRIIVDYRRLLVLREKQRKTAIAKVAKAVVTTT